MHVALTLFYCTLCPHDFVHLYDAYHNVLAIKDIFFAGSGLSGGAIAGIAVGIVVLIALVIVAVIVVFVFLKMRSKL